PPAGRTQEPPRRPRVSVPFLTLSSRPPSATYGCHTGAGPLPRREDRGGCGSPGRTCRSAGRAAGVWCRLTEGAGVGPAAPGWRPRDLESTAARPSPRWGGGAVGAARSKRSTLKDVAREAGVSIGLASRVLRGHGPYSAEAAQRVIEAATRLDYRPDMLARSLRLGRSRALGFVVSYLLSPHWTTFARDVDAAASRHAYQALVGTAATDIAAEQAYLRTLVEHRVAGII